MLRPDTQKFRLLELIGICGEFPANQLNRLFTSPSYAEKIITELKAEKLIRTHYKDKLRGYRLTKRSKELLLAYYPDRFHCCLCGNTETNVIRSEPSRRIRLHQKAQTYLTLLHAGIPFYPDEKPHIFSEEREAASIHMQSLPLFYSSREIKELGAATTKIKNSRSMGILMSPHCVYVIYNTGSGILKWEYKTEVRLNAFLQHYLQGYPYSGHPKIRAIMLGDNMETAFKLLTSTGGYKRSLFILYMNARQEDIPLEHDAVTKDGNPALLAYDFDMQRINRFNTGLNVYGLHGNLICFDFQIPVLKEYLTADIQFSSIDLNKFRRGFLHEP